ncbi:MAG: hypothetical protein HZB33_08190 [Nitrospirae bacterium]|nr:hypothetical protein [Nitrospirota bacterium]
MFNLRYALKNLNVINIILAFAVAMFAVYAVLPLRFKNAAYTPAAVKSPSSAATDTGQKHEEVKPPSPNDYTVIAEQNLFHPDRKIPVPLPPPPPPLPKPDFVLYGTIMTDGAHIAYMEDRKAPKTTQGRGKRQTPVRLGDSLSGFVMKEVSVDKVVMVRGDETIVVQLYDKSKPRDGSQAAAPAAPGPPAAASSPAPAVQKQAPAETPASLLKGAMPGSDAGPGKTRPADRKRRGLFGTGG